MTKLSEILNDDIFQKSFKIFDEDSKRSLVQLLALYGGFEEERSVILAPEKIDEKLNSEFDSVQDFNQKVLQKIYQKIRPRKSDGTGLVERKDIANPEGLIENIFQLDLVELLEKFGSFEERKPPVLENNVRIILNGATQFGCQERIDSVKSFIEQGLIPENTVIDLATGSRDLWPDGIGNDSSNYQPDSMLTILLAERTGKSPEEIVQNISDKRSALISAYQEDNSQLTASSSSLAVSSLSPKQKSDLRANITKNLKSEFLELNPDFVWPQESDMFFRLAQENFPGMSVIVHGGAADRNQGRATGVTGLKKVAVDLIEEVSRHQPSSEISLVVIAGGGHAPRFSAILRDEIKAAGNSKDILDATEIFTFYPVGPSPDRDSFAASNNNVGQNLLNFIEANLGAINHELNRVKPKTSIKQNSSKTLQEENNSYCVIA